MTDAQGFFRPNGLKLLLALTLVVPTLFVIFLVTGFPFDDVVVPVVLALVISYVLGCVLDHTITSRTVKIIIASVAAIVSIVLGYIIVRGMTMVCDPVHDPGRIVCDPVHMPSPEPTAVTRTATLTPQPTVIATAEPTTTRPMIFDPVHESSSCGRACEDALNNAAGITDIVARKLDECLQNCYR